MTKGKAAAGLRPGGSGGGAKLVPAGLGTTLSGVGSAGAKREAGAGDGGAGGGGGIERAGLFPSGDGTEGLLGARGRPISATALAAGLNELGRGGAKSSSSSSGTGRGGGGTRAGGNRLDPAEGGVGTGGAAGVAGLPEGRRGELGAARCEPNVPGFASGGKPLVEEDDGVREGSAGGPVGRGGGGGARY